jgi:hypothetical protein
VENRWGGLESGVKLHGAAWRYWFVVGPPTCAGERRGSDSHAKLDGLATHLGSGGSSSVGAAQTGGVITAVAISSWLVSTLCCVLRFPGRNRPGPPPRVCTIIGCSCWLLQDTDQAPITNGFSVKDADRPPVSEGKHSWQLHPSNLVSGAMSFLCSWLCTFI